jgi:hypothetical protein
VRLLFCGFCRIKAFYKKLSFKFNDLRTKKRLMRQNPRCRIVGRELHPSKEPTLTIHVAGELHLWVIPIRVAAKNNKLLNTLDEADRALVEWVYKNDNMVERYYYQDNSSG